MQSLNGHVKQTEQNCGMPSYLGEGNSRLVDDLWNDRLEHWILGNEIVTQEHHEKRVGEAS